ncbi:MAG: HEPN domain-containing protein, partial [Pseudomonadota bacterium]
MSTTDWLSTTSLSTYVFVAQRKTNVMIKRTELRKLARARLKEAQLLFAVKRYDAATYLSGYAIEMALKARICQTLKWTDFPETNKEFIRLSCEITEKSLKSPRFQKLY